MTWKICLELIVACVIASAGSTGGVLLWLHSQQHLDYPNDRSSHDRPTPRGGGLGIIPILLLAWTIITVLGMAPWVTCGAVLAAAGLAYIGWRDDRVGAGIGLRLVVQTGSVIIGLVCLPGVGHIFQGWLPAWLDIVVTGLIWLWFLNLFNFMDGIDGISGVESIAIGAGVALLAFFTADHETGGLPLGMALASVAAGFLVWNWAPARLFLGDVGSVPLGFLAGWLLLGAAGRGHWAPALILPLYYLVDATGTLVLRILKGRLPWKAHREHAYQRAVQNGHGHGSVAAQVLVANIGLIVLALMAISLPWLALILALIFVAIFVTRMLRQPVADGPSA